MKDVTNEQDTCNHQYVVENENGLACASCGKQVLYSKMYGIINEKEN